MNREPHTSLAEDAGALGIVQSSQAFALLATLLLAGSSAVQSSRVWQVAIAARDRWRSLPWSAQWASLGITLMTGAITHIAANAAFGDSVGREWLFIPGAALIVGVLLLLASIQHGDSGRSS